MTATGAAVAGVAAAGATAARAAAARAAAARAAEAGGVAAVIQFGGSQMLTTLTTLLHKSNFNR